jgi:hypothetical protein
LPTPWEKLLGLTLTTLTFVLGADGASALTMITAPIAFTTAPIITDVVFIGAAIATAKITGTAFTITALTMVHGEPRLYCAAGVFLALMVRSIAIFQGFRSAPGYLRRATPSSAAPI